MSLYDLPHKEVPDSKAEVTLVVAGKLARMFPSDSSFLMNVEGSADMFATDATDLLRVL